MIDKTPSFIAFLFKRPDSLRAHGVVRMRGGRGLKLSDLKAVLRGLACALS